MRRSHQQKDTPHETLLCKSTCSNHPDSETQEIINQCCHCETSTNHACHVQQHPSARHSFSSSHEDTRRLSSSVTLKSQMTNHLRCTKPPKCLSTPQIYQHHLHDALDQQLKQSHKTKCNNVECLHFRKKKIALQATSQPDLLHGDNLLVFTKKSALHDD